MYVMVLTKIMEQEFGKNFAQVQMKFISCQLYTTLADIFKNTQSAKKSPSMAFN
jgi:hypothetical protein